MRPEVFALFHLAILVGLMGVAWRSGRSAKTDAWDNRGTRYHRLSNEDLMKRLGKRNG